MSSNTPFASTSPICCVCADKCHRLPLHQRHANLVRQNPHHRRLLHPGNLLELFAAKGNRDKEDIPPDVFAKHRQHLRARYFRQAAGLYIAGSGDAKARIAFEKGLGDVHCDGQARPHDESAKGKRHASPGAGWPPPWSAHRVTAGFAKPRSFVAVRILHLKRHARQTASRKRHTLLHAPETGLRGRFIFPNQGSGSVTSFYRHA